MPRGYSLPTGFDLTRNAGKIYLKDGNTTIDEALGDITWRERWVNYPSTKIAKFFLEEFASKMAALGYIPPEPQNIVTITVHLKSVKLYHLLLFSRAELGTKFWKETVRGTEPQEELFK